MAWRAPSVVIFAVVLKVIFGVGTSSSWGSRVGMLKVRVYLPVMLIWSRAVSGSRVSSIVSSLLVLRRSLRSSVMFMHICASPGYTRSKGDLTTGHPVIREKYTPEEIAKFKSETI